MTTTRQLYIEGLEAHQELREAVQGIIALGGMLGTESPRIEGCESLADSMRDLGNGMFSVSKWVGGKTIGVFSSVLSAAGTALMRSFSDNETLIKRLLQQADKSDDKEFTLSKEALVGITAEGDIDSISKDMDTFIHSLDILDKHSKDLLSYLDKQLLIVRKLKSVRDTGGIFSVVEEFGGLVYPAFKLQNHRGDTYTSDTLPGGKTWTFEHGDVKSPKYLMDGDTPAGGGSSVTFSKSEISALLTKLDKVNSMHKRLKQSYDSYLTYLKSWSETVRNVDANLNKLEEVSAGAMREAEKILVGDTTTLAFYSGFTPRVVSSTDRYIHGVLGVFA